MFHRVRIGGGPAATLGAALLAASATGGGVPERLTPVSGVCHSVAVDSRGPTDPLVLPGETIVGRAAGNGAVFLLTDQATLLAVSLEDLSVARHRVNEIASPERIWGLARLSDGTLWTLLDRTVLGQLTAQGTLAQRIALNQPHLGLYGLGRQLVYQLLPSPPQVTALTVGPPGNMNRRAIGSLRLRSSNDLRAEVWVRNLVYCGSSRGSRLPCWFADEATVDVIDADEQDHRVRLTALETGQPRNAPKATEPLQPIWDAIVFENELWVLSSAESLSQRRTGESQQWHLLRFGFDGRVHARCRVDASPRLMLDVDGDTCSLLTWQGSVHRVVLP